MSVLSTNDAIEQLATAAIASGRVEAVAGRGSSPIRFPLFDYDERDYDMLYGSKLEQVLAINGHDRVTWSGPQRQRPLEDILIVPKPEQPLRLWLGTRGSLESVCPPVELGLPMFLVILGGRRSTGRSTATRTARSGPRPATPPRTAGSRSRCREGAARDRRSRRPRRLLLGAVAGHLRVRDTRNPAKPLPPLALPVAVLVLRLLTA